MKEWPSNYARLRNLTAREVIAALGREGFTLDRQTGSHRHYRQADGRRVTISFHSPGETFARKTLRSIVETQARWKAEDLDRLGLGK